MPRYDALVTLRPQLLLPSLALALACSEYALEGKSDASGGADTAMEGDDPPETSDPPDIAVSPDSVRAGVVCDPAAYDIEVRNRGERALVLSDAQITGDGWTFSGPELPLNLTSGSAAQFIATGTGGEATLTFSSNDPDTPELEVPLSGTRDKVPSVWIDGPPDGTVIAEGSDITLRGSVLDPEDTEESLTVTWTSSQDGVLATTTAASDGTTELAWPATARAPADHDLTLSVTDSCGQTSADIVGICQQAITTYSELDLVDWHFEGVSFWDSANEWLQLTSADTYVVGSAFETGHIVNGGEVEIDFMFYIGGGSGADGISLTALDIDRHGGAFLGGDGCGIGFGGGLPCTPGPALPGWSLEVDTHHNTEPEGLEPTSSHHIAFYFDGNLADIAAWSAIDNMEDTGWHNLRVVVEAPHLLVQIDGTTYIDQELDGAFDFNAWLGFTAGTGGMTNNHLIDSLEVTEAACEE